MGSDLCLSLFETALPGALTSCCQLTIIRLSLPDTLIPL